MSVLYQNLEMEAELGQSEQQMTPSQPTGEATWNPALRRNSEADPVPRPIADLDKTPLAGDQDEEDDFFSRYPGATPKKPQLDPPSSSPADGTSEPQGEEGDEQGDVRRQSISVEQVVDIRQDDATPEDLMRVPSNHVEVKGPLGGNATSREEDAEPTFDPEETVYKNKINLERFMDEATPLAGQGHDGFEFTSPDEPMIEEVVDLDPSEHYEHQSDPTALESALETSADAPLMDDEEPLPTPGYVSREPMFNIPAGDEEEDALGLDGEASPRVQPQLKSSPAQPSLDRSFTTNFSTSPIDNAGGQPQQGTERAIPSDWPSVGDDKTFGELLDNAKAVPSASEQFPIEEALLDDDEDALLPEEDGETPAEDLAAAWGAAIDEDELLDDTPLTATGNFDPSAAFGEDDSGFLEDEPLQAPVQQQRQQPYSPGMSSQQMFLSGHGRSAGTPSSGLDLSDMYNTPALSQQQVGSSSQAQRPAMQPSAQSFVDKAKGGYQSPYDLPMDVVKPRRRPQQTPQQQQPKQFASPPLPSTAAGAPFGGPVSLPPPRSSSMSSSFSQARTLPPQTPTAGHNAATLSPPTSRDGLPAANVTSTPKTGGGGFFEDLPVTAKPRQRPTFQQQGTAGIPTPPPHMPPSRQNTGPYTPGIPPTQPQPGGHITQMASHPPTPQQQQQVQQMYGGLQRPEQMSLLPAQSAAPISPPQEPFAAPPQNTRYSPSQQQQIGTSSLSTPAGANRFSPAPPPIGGASAGGRYSPAPAAGQPKARNPSLPFAPRTSSPLAAGNAMHQPSGPQAQLLGAQAQLPASPPRVNGLQGAAVSPERSGSRYAPTGGHVQQPPQHQYHQQPYPAQPAANFAPPPARPRTQSPDATMKGPRANAMAAGMALARASSSAEMTTPNLQQPSFSQTSSHLASSMPSPKRPALPHRRQFSRDLTFTAPQDERSLDPLQRWKGHPIFHWSASGAIVTTFPKQTPFYSAAQGLPSVKCTPGHITMQDASTFLPLDERTAKFPGPLVARRKGAKKELLPWIVSKVEDLDREADAAALRFEDGEDAAKRAKEKAVLWKLLRIFVENDGSLEGSPKIEEEIRKVLLPDLAQMAQVADLQSPGSIASEAADKQTLLQIRQALLEGQRERAVWLAEEKKLWGHAMLIASTMGPETWKSIASSFVRAQVQSVGSDVRSTAALYQVFAGNAEECVDELVPPSARAGFRMVAKEDGRIGGNPLEGLDQWRETLGLVVGNRTAGDGASLKALGKLLAGYGRVEAAGACFLFARQVIKVSGSDDVEADMVLLGGGKDEGVVGADLDPILATEIFEYASSLSAPANSPLYLPHLQAYKLLHAQNLAACGLKTKAQAYTEAITSAYTSTTRPSGYYHPTFTSAVAEFNAFLSQSPQDGKAGSFFSKPAMKTVSSGAASWFTKFVAGDEDSDSNASGGGGALTRGEGAAGPFGGVSGESPELSRNASGTDLYAPAMGGFAPSSAPTGRYAPGAPQQLQQQPRYAPSGLSNGNLGIPPAEPQRPSSGYSRYAPAPSPLAAGSLGVPRPDFARRGSDHSSQYAPLSRRGSAQETSSQGSYEPRPVLADDAGSGYSYSPAVQSPVVFPQQAPAVQEPAEAPLDAGINQFYSPPIDDAPVPDAEGGVFEPPTSSSGYEPPSYSTYQPYEPEPDSPADEALKAKKKTFGDDDDEDDLARRAAALKSSQQSAADRQADDAFRKAAEADAARDKAGADGKKGWLSGWWGKKDPSMPTSGPIKAKLGEENSFYYDEELKKWVNKKGGAEAAVAAAPTPPPPRAASRVASGPPASSGPPSRASSGLAGGPPPSALAAGMRPPTSASMALPGSGPPSRSATPASELGGPAGGSVNGDVPPALPPFSAATAAAMAPPGRPSSSLSTASSIDDLLGGPPGAGSRKGGTVKGKKKGGRYVDVMAK